MIKKYSIPKDDGDKKNMRINIENFINYYGWYSYDYKDKRQIINDLLISC